MQIYPSHTHCTVLHCYSGISVSVVHLYDVLLFECGFTNLILEPGMFYMLNLSRYNSEQHSNVDHKLYSCVQLLRQTLLLCAVAYVRDRPEHYNSGKYFPRPHSSIEWSYI